MSNPVRRVLAAVLAIVLAGGVAITFAPPASAAGPDQIDLRGHGYGHGRGMGQYGARGYADDRGWSTDQILNHYYGGTSKGSRDPGTPVRVLLCDLEGVTICGSGTGIPQITVTSGAAFTIEGIVLPAGTLLRVTRESTSWKVEQASGTCSAPGLYGPVGGGSSVDSVMDIDSTVANPGDDTSKMLQLCGPKSRTYRGVLDFLLDGSKPRLVNYLGIDGYLKGVVPSEMPSTWNAAALRVQAVAARSYALSGDNRFGSIADTCDTIQCQVYLGAANERASTNAAIVATAGEVRLSNSNNAVARTEFSSSTGGWTAGGTFPAVEDLGDATSSNPHHTWTTSITDDRIEAAYAIGDLTNVEVTSRNNLGEDGGRVKNVRITGTSSTVNVSGDAFRSKFGLKSDWYSISIPPPTTSPSTSPTTSPTTVPVPPVTTPPPPAPEPKVLGWVTRNSATPGSPSGNVNYGAPGYIAISCDWDNNGTDTLGVYTAGNWYLRDNMSPGSPTRSFAYGAPGYTPVCGDWDGDGQDSIGVYTAGTWYLRNDVGPGAPQITFSYGYDGAVPVVGNWDGSDRAVEIGVYDQGTWYLRNNTGPGQPANTISYGYAGPQPVIGDWNGNGVDGFGVYDQGSWYLRETTSPGRPDRQFAYGYPGPVPVTGRWTAAADGVGIIETR